VYTKTKKELPFKLRAISIFVLFIAFGIFAGQAQERRAAELDAQEAKEQARKVAEARQEDVDYFNSNKSKIISSASSALADEKYQTVIRQTGKYLPANDAELNEIYRKAKKALDEMARVEKEKKEKLQREAKTKELLNKLKRVPASEFKENKKLYQQLVRLNPGDAKYKQKFDYYSHKLDEKLENEKREQEKLKKERESRIAKFGEPPTRSAWDGSYYAVERHLKRVANDPDSIEIDGCTKVYHTKKGWLVGCDYRGRNGFGGMVRQSNWFTIVYNQVIEMHDATAYSP
tara:strand:- start:29460 stop:30326 length:867 start_codon:yes stop_codon:yes gene_type:complete